MATPYPPLPIFDLNAPPVGAEMPADGQASGAASVRCDVCDEPIAGEPAGEGLYLWSRGGELIYEPAPLCEGCALAVNVRAGSDADIEEEEG
jgi:hypothetical protein